jgi:hypothetical protein
MKHKHADIIKAWADGAQIQSNNPNLDGSEDWEDETEPRWYNYLDYRIKPEPVPDRIVVTELWRKRDYGLLHMGEFRLTIDGETGKLKSAEVL